MGREVSKRTKSQCDKILDFMQKHGSITQMDAVEFGCYRLSARIFDLRDAGYPITTTMRVSKNRDGHTMQYAVYRIGAEDGSVLQAP